MIKDFCGSLSSVFSSTAYYGVVSEDDAQCFYVESLISNSIYFLVVASMFLYATTRFVKKASLQQLMDDKITIANAANVTEEELQLHLADKDMSGFGDEDVTKNIAKEIKPLKVHFTDEHCCLLKVMNEMGSKVCISPSEKRVHFISDDASASLSMSDVEMNSSTRMSWEKSSAFEKPCADDDDFTSDEDAIEDKRSIISTLSNSTFSMTLWNSVRASHLSPDRTNKATLENSIDASATDIDVIQTTMPFFGKDLDDELTSGHTSGFEIPIRRR